MRILFLLFFLIPGFQSFAIDISFVVYHSKGAVMKKGNKKPLKKGDRLLPQDIVNLEGTSQLVLVCSNYKVIQLKKPGAYAVKSLLQLCIKSAAAYNSAYFKYVWDQFTNPEGSPDKNPGEYMKNVGAVSRGCNEYGTSLQSDTVHYYAGSLPVYWRSAFDTVYATVYDQLYDGVAIKKILLQKNQPFLLQSLLQDLPPGNYYWQLEGPQGSACERKYLQLWDKKTYQNQVTSLLKNIPPATSADEAFARAFVLHEHFFMAEALVWYQKAAKLEPKNPIYNKAIEAFYEQNF